MKKRCLFFGNCQMHIIKEILKQTYFNQQYECDLFSSHINTCDDLEKLYQKLNTYSFVAIQPHNNYRNNPKYNIENIVMNVNSDCKIIIMPSCYFNFYYPFLTYAHNNDELIRDPSDYHDKNFIDLYNKEKKNVSEEYKKMLDDEGLLSIDELTKMAENSIMELKRRETEYMNKDYGRMLDYKYITISDFVNDNYKKELLFYSMNHPSYNLFKYICNKTLKILNLKNYINSFSFYDPLSYLHPPLYRCIQKVVEFDISKYRPNINNKNNIDDIINMYLEKYNTYNNIHY